MPLLNIDLAHLASDILPEGARESVHAMSVRARLATLSIVSEGTGNTSVRDVALHALSVIDMPAYVGISAIRTALQGSSALLRRPVDRFAFLVAVASSTVPQKEGFAEYTKWPRKECNRWLLTVTTRDVAKALASR